MTREEHTAEALKHAERVTAVGERDIIRALVHALLSVSKAITQLGLDKEH